MALGRVAINFSELNKRVAMTELEALQSVQYVTVSNKRFAVVEGDMWEILIEWLERWDDVREGLS